jgi:hypothetical protein
MGFCMISRTTFARSGIALRRTRVSLATDSCNQSSPSSEKNVELESVDYDILVRLKGVPDPAKFVLEII